jgi:hypothetical protein
VAGSSGSCREEPPSENQNPGHARRDPGGRCFGRGFNSRRLHQAEPGPECRHNAGVASYMRILFGVVIGLAVGLLITVVVIVAKVGFFVNTPRAAHPFVLAAFFAVPALAGGLIGAFWKRSSRRT